MPQISNPLSLDRGDLFGSHSARNLKIGSGPLAGEGSLELGDPLDMLGPRQDSNAGRLTNTPGSRGRRITSSTGTVRHEPRSEQPL